MDITYPTTTRLEETSVVGKMESKVTSTAEPNFEIILPPMDATDKCDNELEFGGVFIQMGLTVIEAKYQIQLNFDGCLPVIGALYAIKYCTYY